MRHGTSAQWKRLATASLLAVGSVVVVAQDRQPARSAPEGMTAERSREIQAELQRIDSNKAAWVDNFLTDWDRALDPSRYDIRHEFTATAMKAPAWQLYAASLTGDFETMVQVMRGRRSAGQIINSLSTPQRRVSATPTSAARPVAFGSAFDNLVFTPIAPCRVLDTRPGPGGPGVRTGILAANATRLVDLEDDAFTAGQGVTGPCPGLPTSSSAYGWAINITVTSVYSFQGGLKAWGASDPEPNASVINWQAGQAGAIANGVIVIGNVGGADDINIKAFGDGTHVIIDVMGYFDSSGTFDATTSRLVGTNVIIVTNGNDYVYGGNCPAGTRLIAGEELDDGYFTTVSSSYAVSTTQWVMWANNRDGVSRTFTVWSRCLDTPIQI